MSERITADEQALLSHLRGEAQRAGIALQGVTKYLVQKYYLKPGDGLGSDGTITRKETSHGKEGFQGLEGRAGDTEPTAAPEVAEAHRPIASEG